MAGTTVRCDKISRYLDGPVASEFCALLVGWDGDRLPVVAMPLVDGPAEPPSNAGTLESRFDVSLNEAEASRGKDGNNATSAQVVDLHVEPESGRLWALLSDGRLRIWDLFSLSNVRTPTVRWRRKDSSGEKTKFSALAISGAKVFVAGLSSRSYPELLAAEMSSVTASDSSITSAWQAAPA